MRKQLEELRMLCKTETSQASILRKLGYTNSPGNYGTLKRLAEEFGLDLPDGSGTGHATQRVLRPLEEILVESSTYTNNQHLKNRVLNAGLLLNRCFCGQGPEWNGKSLTLQLDHINGIHNDNRIENLRIICPNCHAQTQTFCKGKKWRQAA